MRNLQEREEDLAAFPIVGIGASAGGVEALRSLLAEIPSDVALAFVVVQHLSPHRESFLPTVLATSTRLPVSHADRDTKIEPGHVYVVPPDRFIQLSDGHLRLSQRPSDSRQFTPINHFFGSLATFGQNRAIGVVLSGNASDGALGIREIRGNGGVTMAQDPTSARFDSMPRAAIAAGVDYVLAPSQIAHELLRIASHPSVKPVEVRKTKKRSARGDSQVHLKTIFRLLREGGGVDFSNYKSPTILRRLHRQMVLRRITTLEEYVEFLEKNPAEVASLGQSILIHVTRFFRDPEAFEVLGATIARRLEKRGSQETFRVWVPGCATGEEAYSVAIALTERLGPAGRRQPLQIFGTDVSDQAIDRARRGVYPEAIESDVPSDYLRKYFTRVDDSYRIAQSVRDVCIFARQDVTHDPPFSRVDLIVCRNLLIYLDLGLQKRTLGIFYYALKPEGYLMLGLCESTGPEAESFDPVDKKHKIYSKRAGRLQPQPQMRGGAPFHRVEEIKQIVEPRAEIRVQKDAERILLDRYTPPAVLLDDDFQIRQIRGDVSRLFTPGPGHASLSVFKMARPGLATTLRAVLERARSSKKAVRRKGVVVRIGSTAEEVTIEAVPIRSADGVQYFLVLFEPSVPGIRLKPPAKRDRSATRGLERELEVTRGELQSIIQDLEAANEELQSANEEILSSNEELQSTNEELDTAREELQSTNEEIITVNEELHGRNEDLARVNSDLINLLASVQIPIVMVDGDLRVRRFTPLAEKALNLIPSDIGRPLSQIKPNIDCPTLISMITEALDKATVQEQEVRDLQDRVYSLKVRPYKNVDNRIDGAVIVLVDIDNVRRQQFEAGVVDGVVEVTHEPLLVLLPDFHITHASWAFCQMFRIDRSGLVGQSLFEIDRKRWDEPALQEALGAILARGGLLRDFEIVQDLGNGARRRLFINARRLEIGSETRLLVAIAPASEPAPKL